MLKLHRPSNVAVRDAFVNILHALEEIQHSLPLLFPVHSRTRKRIEEFGFMAKVQVMKNLHLTEPLGYLDFLKLTAEAQLVLTDSGSIQEETTILQVPCLTLRENTDRPVTLEQDTNALVGTDPERITRAAFTILQGHTRSHRVPELWDGKAAEQIVNNLRKHPSSL